MLRVKQAVAKPAAVWHELARTLWGSTILWRNSIASCRPPESSIGPICLYSRSETVLLPFYGNLLQQALTPQAT